MWLVIKVEKKKIELLKQDFKKSLGNDLKLYIPKVLIHKTKKNKIKDYEFNLLGDYLFCYHKKFSDKNIIKALKFSRGLKYFLGGFLNSQLEISNFINRCKEYENKDGFLNYDFFELNINSKYKFLSGPFSDVIFKILKIQKNNLKILINNFKTTIKKKDFCFKTVY